MRYLKFLIIFMVLVVVISQTFGEKSNVVAVQGEPPTIVQNLQEANSTLDAVEENFATVTKSDLAVTKLAVTNLNEEQSNLVMKESWNKSATIKSATIEENSAISDLFEEARYIDSNKMAAKGKNKFIVGNLSEEQLVNSISAKELNMANLKNCDSADIMRC